MNVFDYVTKTNGKYGVMYEGRPGEIYPAMAALIQTILESGANVPGALIRYHTQAKAMGADAFDLVNLANGDTPPALVPTRALALEICRLWFTELLHAALDYGFLHLHLEFDEFYKL